MLNYFLYGFEGYINVSSISGSEVSLSVSYSTAKDIYYLGRLGGKVVVINSELIYNLDLLVFIF